MKVATGMREEERREDKINGENGERIYASEIWSGTLVLGWSTGVDPHLRHVRAWKRGESGHVNLPMRGVDPWPGYEGGDCEGGKRQT